MADFRGDLNSYPKSIQFPATKRRLFEANFTGGDITSEGGVLIVRQADQRLQLCQAVAEALDDGRRQAGCTHDTLRLIRQRLYGLTLGYEDLNDHQQLRLDPAIQSAINRDQPLASSSTLCRFENQFDRDAAWALHEVLVNQFIASFKHPHTFLLFRSVLSDRRVPAKRRFV